jgi:hypothetical protein
MANKMKNEKLIKKRSEESMCIVIDCDTDAMED